MGATVALGFFIISEFPFLLRPLLPAFLRRTALEKKSREIFIREKVFSTRERTGLLIVVSLLERAVYILADQGLLAKVPESEWATLAQKLAADFDHHDPGASFFEALQALTDRLKKDFPPRADNPDELSNKLR